MAGVRSGSHLEQIGDTWYYRRVVPPDARTVFGKKNERFSLRTNNLTEARRLEKEHDVEFEAKLRLARETSPAGYPKHPEALLRRILQKSREAKEAGEPIYDYTELGLTEEDEAALHRQKDKVVEEYEAQQIRFAKLWSKLEEVIPWADDDQSWEMHMADIVEVVQAYVDRQGEFTLDWAYQKWSEAKNRPRQTADDADRYLTGFQKSARIRLLAGVRRYHLTDWREQLRRDGKLGSTSINHRLEIVSAILRTGWREAEMQAVNLERINLPESEDGDRAAWTRAEILSEMALLEPGSWAAWIYILGLTTGTRLGEFVAARKEWYDPLGFISVPARFTKMKKPHVVPIIKSIRPALEAHVSRLPNEVYLFDAPRPSNEDLKLSHEASKWFSRFHQRHKIPKVIHELRHTWLEAARESPIKKEIYEIISGHSPKTVSDKYGGAKPRELLKANEMVCRQFLKNDQELVAAIRRLVGN